MAIVLTLGRFHIRRRYSCYHWDDLFNGLAVLCLIVLSVLDDPELAIDPDTVSYWQVGLAVNMLLWTILYLVKASFLAFCWLFFQISPKFRRFWWAITIYTFSTFWPILIGELWECGDPAKYADPTACIAFANSSNAAQFYLAEGSIATALHVSSDLFILGLPLIFIGQLQMSISQKFSAGAVFTLIIIDIMMGLTRNIIAATSELQTFVADHTFIDLDIILAIFEPSLAVIVCALPAYRSLLPVIRRKRNDGQEEIAQDNVEALAPTRRRPQNAVFDDSIAELERPVV